jgi:hypothetical protein
VFLIASGKGASKLSGVSAAYGAYVVWVWPRAYACYEWAVSVMLKGIRPTHTAAVGQSSAET